MDTPQNIGTPTKEAMITIDKFRSDHLTDVEERIHVEPVTYEFWMEHSDDESLERSDIVGLKLRLIEIHDQMVANGWRPVDLPGWSSAGFVFDFYSARPNLPDQLFAYKYCPEVSEFFLWNLGEHSRVSEAHIDKVRKDLRRKAKSSGLRISSKRKKFLGIF